jgi:hypothetical protein
MRLLSTFLALALLSGCASLLPRSAEPPAVTHVVVCWLKRPGNPEDRARLIAGGRSLERIPGIVRIRSGEVLPSKRPAVVSDYDVAFVMEFASEADLRAYERHPAHLAAVRDVLLPLVSRFQVYDFAVAH